MITPNAVEDTKKPDHSFINSKNVNCIATVWETVWKFLKNLPYNLAPRHISHMYLDIYPRKIKICVHRKICTRLFTAAYSPKWKPPRCPSMDEKTNWGTTILWNTICNIKNEYMQQLGYISREWRWMKRANLKRFHSLWLYLYNILEIAKV